MEGAGGEEWGGRGERKTSERQTRGERRESAERGPAAVSAPAGIVCAARAPSPAPHGPATDTLRQSPAVSPCLCPHSPPKTGEQPSRTCSPEEGRGTERAGGTRHPPRGPRGGARPADSFPPRAGPSGETGGGEGGEEMGAPLWRTIRDGEGTGRGAGARWAEGLPGGEGRGRAPPRGTDERTDGPATAP